MPDFSDAQKQARNQTQAQNQSNEMRDVVRDLRSSSQNLSNTNANQTLQQQQLVQAIQQQSQQIQALTMQVQSSALRQPPPLAPSAPTRPIVAPAFQQAGAVAGMVGGHLKQRGQELGGMAFHQYEMMRHTGYGVQRDTPGLLHTPQSGMMGSALHASGLTWNPSAAQSYGFGAYQDAQAYNAGRSAQRWGMGAMGTAMGMLSTQSLGGIAGGIAGGMIGGPFAPLTAAAGSFAGSMAAAPLDYFNPLSFGMQEAQRSLAFGASANQNSNRFLRGMGDRGGAFGIREQTQIGSAISDMSLKDLTFSNQDFQQLQGQFSDAGLMLGSRGADQYIKRFRDLMDNQKSIMKALQLTQEEAVQFMSTAFSDIGVNPGQQMSMLASQVGAAAHISGLSPMQTAQMMAAGGQGANALGLMNLTGARTMGAAIGLGGTAANGAVNTRTLASVGGEQGLINVLAQAQNRFLAGPGGAMGVFGGKGGVFQRMGRLGQVTSDDMINFAATGNEMIDDMMEKDPTYARRQMIMDLDQMASMMPGKNHRAKMIMLAQSQLGLGRTEAQALVDSAKALPGAIANENMARRRNNTNLTYDQIAEQRGIINRFRLGAREMMMDDMGGGAVRDTLLETAGDLGLGVELGVRDFTDRMYGIKERSLIGSDVMGKVKKMGISGYGSDAVKASKYTKRVGSILDSGTAESDLLSEAMSEAFGTTKTDTVRDVIGGAMEGGAAAGALTMGAGAIPGAIAGGANALANPEHRFDITKMRKIVKAIEQDQPVKSAMELDVIDVSGEMTPQEKRKIQDLARRHGVSDEGMKQLRRELGVKGSGAKVKSEKDLMEETKKAFGIEGTFDAHKFNRAFESPLFQEIMADLQELSKMYDPNGRQTKEYETKRREIFRKIQKLSSEDPEAADQAKEILRKMGVKITDNGLDVKGAMKDMMDKAQADNPLTWKSDLGKITKEKGMFGGGVSGKLDTFNVDRMKQGEAKALSTGLNAIGKGGYTLDDGLDEGEIGSIVSDVSQLDKEEIEKLRGMGKWGNLVADISGIAKKGDLDERTQEYLVASLRNMGAEIEATSGSSVSAGGLDGDVLGSKTVEAFQKVHGVTDKQIQVLQQIADKL